MRRLLFAVLIAIALAAGIAQPASAVVSPGEIFDAPLRDGRPRPTPTPKPAPTRKPAPAPRGMAAPEGVAEPRATPAPRARDRDRDRDRATPRATPAPTRGAPAPTTPAATTPDDGLGLGIDPLAPLPGGSGGSQQVPGTPGGRGDWFATNGLKAPSCRGSREPSCLDSGTRSIPVAPGYYDLDTWMESGTLGLPKWSNLLAEITAFVWSLIVSITAGLFAALEWALSFDLLLAGDGALSRLKVLESSWGMPVAGMLLVLGVMWVAVQTIFPRRMGAALSNAWLGFLVAGIAMAVLSNPAGTIGELGKLTGEAGRSVAATPLQIVDRGETLDGGLSRMWEAAVERPYALLEFGDVKWGTQPGKLDPDLAAAARELAGDSGDHIRRRAAQANTNARFTLLWAANSDQRNNSDDEGVDGKPSLLRVMCGTDKVDECEGPMARHVEARTEKGVRDRALQVFVIGLGMLALWVVLAGIVFGLLWSTVTAVITLIELSYTWPLAMTFKPEWRKHVSEQLMRLVGTALAYVVFGLAAAITMTVFMLTQRLDEGWLVQWGVSLVAMVVLFLRRKKIKGLMETLISGQKTADAAGGFGSRLLSSYATGLGLGAMRGKGGVPKMPAGARRGAAGAGGGGVPDRLPGEGSGGGFASGRGAMAAAAVAGGAVAGPVGSAAAIAALKRGAVLEGAGVAASKVSGAAGRVQRGLDQTAAGRPGGVDGAAVAAGGVGPGGKRPGGGAGGGRAAVVGPGGVVTPKKQAAALLAGQRAARTAAAAEARAQLPEAREALLNADAHVRAGQYSANAQPEGSPSREAAEARLHDAEQVRAHAAGVVDDLEHVEAAGANTDTWLNDSGQGFSADATTRADGWLDQQSELPAHSRAYRQLAAMHGITPSQWTSMDPGEQEPVRAAIDASLTARAAENVLPPRRTPLQALGAIANAQTWRQAR